MGIATRVSEQETWEASLRFLYVSSVASLAMSVRPAPTAASGGPAPRAGRGFQGIAPVSDGHEETRAFAPETAGGRMHGIGHLSHASENPAAQPRLFRARGQVHLGSTGRRRAGDATHTFSGGGTFIRGSLPWACAPGYFLPALRASGGGPRRSAGKWGQAPALPRFAAAPVRRTSRFGASPPFPSGLRRRARGPAPDDPLHPAIQRNRRLRMLESAIE